MRSWMAASRSVTPREDHHSAAAAPVAGENPEAAKPSLTWRAVFLAREVRQEGEELTQAVRDAQQRLGDSLGIAHASTSARPRSASHAAASARSAVGLDTTLPMPANRGYFATQRFRMSFVSLVLDECRSSRARAATFRRYSTSSGSFQPGAGRSPRAIC